ncbi:MAG: hypothetical protein KDA24_01325 [Deltaproteobacteria bacterium]|nr:hypothetical protein [Deltaproteobacteria bacterium]
MNALAMMQLLATAPLFASRAFLAAFLVALTARFGGAIPFLSDSSAITALQAAPPWFTSDVAVIVLGVLAVLEATAERSVDARRMLTELGPYLKLGAALAINLGLADAQTSAMLQELTVYAPEGVLHAGLDASHALATGAALFTFWLAVMRKRALSFLLDADEEDDLGLQGALVWVEDAFVFGGVAALAVFPALALVVLGMTAAALFALDRWTAHREASRRVPCGSCEVELHPSAPHCPSCNAARDASALGFLGRPKESAAGPRHPQLLLAAKRCPHCATRLGKARLDQVCSACGKEAFASRADVDAYLSAVQRQLPKTLLVCALFGAIPLLGLIPGIIYYRLSLLGGLRRYLRPGASFTTRWLSRFLTIGLLALQWIPVVGAAMLPLLALANYALYRRALVGTADTVFAV